MEQSKITFEQYIGLARKKEAHEKKKVNVGKVVSFVILTIFCIAWLLPFVLLFVGSLRSPHDATFFPKEIFVPHSGYSLSNYKLLLTGDYSVLYDEGEVVQGNTMKDFQIGYWFLNTCISAIGGTVLYLLVASFAAYAFTFIDFKYRNVLFAILIGTMVIPGTATAVGNQNTVFALGLDKSMLALIIPGLGGVYGMYLIRTFFTSIPKDLIESAKMDGYSNLKIFFKIVLPLGKTVIFVQGLFGFMGGWNDLVWPQMLYGYKDSKMWTLQVGMAYVVNNTKTSSLVGTSLASGVICVLPVLVVYLIAQNYIIEGMASAGIKK